MARIVSDLSALAKQKAESKSKIDDFPCGIGKLEGLSESHVLGAGIAGWAERLARGNVIGTHEHKGDFREP
jgi:hypothetical protein